MLLVSRSRLVEEDAILVFRVITCPLLSWSKISIPCRESNNVVVFPFPFHSFMPLANLWFICLQGKLPILRTSWHDLYPLIGPPRMPLGLIEGESLSRDSFVPSYVSNLWHCPLYLTRRIMWIDNLKRTCCTWSHGLRTKKWLKVMWWRRQFLSVFLAYGHLPWVSRQSRLMSNDKGDNEMISGDVHRSPGICLMAEENPGKPLIE